MVVKQYKAKMECSNCPFKQKRVSRLFTVNVRGKIWTFARGQKPRLWFVDEEAELNFYGKDGNYCEAGDAEYGVIFGLCPQHNKESRVNISTTNV